MDPGNKDSDNSAVPVNSIKKRDNEEIRISLSKYSGTEFIDIRSYYLSQDDSEFKPSRKGVTLGRTQYQELLSGILELGAVLGELAPDSADRVKDMLSNRTQQDRRMGGGN